MPIVCPVDHNVASPPKPLFEFLYANNHLIIRREPLPSRSTLIADQDPNGKRWSRLFLTGGRDMWRIGNVRKGGTGNGRSLCSLWRMDVLVAGVVLVSCTGLVCRMRAMARERVVVIGVWYECIGSMQRGFKTLWNAHVV